MVQRCGWIKYQSRFAALITNQLKGAINVLRCLRMEANDIGAGFCKIGDKAVNRLDHQVNVNRHLYMGPNRFADQWADCQIGNIMVVHHIEMDDICAGRYDIADFFAQTSEVGRQYARSDAVGRHVFSLLASGEFYLDEAACLPQG